MKLENEIFKWLREKAVVIYLIFVGPHKYEF